MNEKKIDIDDFKELFKDEISLYLEKKIKEYEFSYIEVDDKERDILLKKIVSVLLDNNIVSSGEHRHEQWVRGWNENLDELAFKPGKEAINPKYFGKYNNLRLRQKFIHPLSKDFERNSLWIIIDWMADKYLRDFKTIYEFGCGTGHNLLRVREVNPKAALWGCDWAESSQEIIKKINESGVDKNIFGQRFDFFKPDKGFNLEKDSAVFTVAALEQVGTRFKDFIQYLFENRPKICVHIEPIAELLDENNLLDYLSIEYFKKRNYLSGYLTYLRELEKQGEIQILIQERNYIGSLFIEGYSVVVWRLI